MKYNMTARLFPLIFDRYAYAWLREQGIHTIIKNIVHREYRAMILRTPELPKDNSLMGNLLMGCYILSFYKAYPKEINEDIFHRLVLAVCNSKPMVNGHKKENPFDIRLLEQKESDAVRSQKSQYEMDWQYDFKYDEGIPAYDLTYTKCGLCRLGERENCLHLIKYLCEADYITYSLMGAALKRTQTIAGGDACCDFHVTRKESL